MNSYMRYKKSASFEMSYAIFGLLLNSEICLYGVFAKSYQADVCKYPKIDFGYKRNTIAANDKWTLVAENCVYNNSAILLRLTEIDLVKYRYCRGSLKTSATSDTEWCVLDTNTCYLVMSNEATSVNPSIASQCSKVILRTINQIFPLKIFFTKSYYYRGTTFRMEYTYIMAAPETTSYVPTSTASTVSSTTEEETTIQDITTTEQSTTVQRTAASSTNITHIARSTANSSTATTFNIIDSQSGKQNISIDRTLVILFGVFIGILLIVLFIFVLRCRQLKEQLQMTNANKTELTTTNQEVNQGNGVEAVYSVVNKQEKTRNKNAEREIVFNELYNL